MEKTFKWKNSNLVLSYTYTLNCLQNIYTDAHTYSNTLSLKIYMHKHTPTHTHFLRRTLLMMMMDLVRLVNDVSSVITSGGTTGRNTSDPHLRDHSVDKLEK